MGPLYDRAAEGATDFRDWHWNAARLLKPDKLLGDARTDGQPLPGGFMGVGKTTIGRAVAYRSVSRFATAIARSSG